MSVMAEWLIPLKHSTQEVYKYTEQYKNKEILGIKSPNPLKQGAELIGK